MKKALVALTAYLAICLGVLCLVPQPRLLHADERALATKRITELTDLGAAPASNDKIPVYDISALDVKRLDASWFVFNDGTGPTAAQVDYLTSLSAAEGAALENAARFSYRICGDATTVNNNTVYYGPSLTLTANTHDGLACDITAAGNTTEATADEPILQGTAHQVLGMVCRLAADLNADISFTLRTAAGATTPSVTCTIPDNSISCAANVQTTTNIAAGATVAIAAASTSNLGADGFVCNVSAAY